MVQFQGMTRRERLSELLDELGTRQMTNVLVEGGGQLIGSLFDVGEINEVHVFVSPRLIGGQRAPTPVAGAGISAIKDAIELRSCTIQQLDEDIYVHGRACTAWGSQQGTSS